MHLRPPLFALLVVLPCPLIAQDTLPAPLQAAAESLAAGHVKAAIALAQHYTWDHPRDARGFLALGDAYAARLPTGRFRAIDNYRRARSLSPGDPEPPYRIAQMALRLGGDDGERTMRENLDRVLAMDPEYKNAWGEWLLAYRNAGGRARMIERLRSFEARPGVRLRIAQLYIESEEYGAAGALLDSVLATDPTDPAALALRAQEAFEDGDTLTGFRFYRRALALAAADSTDMLWRQLIGIATPAEIIAWRAGVAPTDKGRWLERFWARRNPDLFSGVNHRVSEHFARLRYARRHYPLLHPMVLFQRSGVGRDINLEPSTAEREFYTRCELRQAQEPWAGNVNFVPQPGVGSPTELARVSGGAFAHLTRKELGDFQHMLRMHPTEYKALLESDPFVFVATYYAPLNMDLRDVDSVAARIGYNLATGLDDRGVMYLRFGSPDRMVYGGDNSLDPMCSSTEVERWHYPGLGVVRFAKPAAFSEGARNVSEMVFRSMNERQFAVMDQGLTRDASSLPAPLEFGVWMAQFRDTMDAGRTDVVIVTTRGEVAATLVGQSGGPRGVSTSASGRLTLTAAPGTYTLLTDGRMTDTLGRQEFHATLRAFDTLPSLSDLLLAPAWPEQVTDRPTMVAHVARDLTFPVGTVVRCYAEVYGLGAAGGVVRYHAAYQLLRSDHPERDIQLAEWPEATRIEFDREATSEPGRPVPEVLDIDPRKLPAGRYLLRLSVRDLQTRVDAGRAAIAFVVR